MNEPAVDIQKLEGIFDSMVNVMDQSKNDIFMISEQSRRSFESLQRELVLVKEDISRVTTEGDSLEEITRHSHRRPADVSKDYVNFSEQEVQKANEVANDGLVRLSVNRIEEKQLRTTCDDLDRRLAELLQIIERADQLVNQVSTAVSYLTSDLKNVGQALETARFKDDFVFQIIQAQEEERKRVSREIHDGPAQMMASVLIRSDLVEKVYQQSGPENALSEFRDLKEMVRSSLYEVRRIIYDLRPMAIDDLGVVLTLRKYLSTLMEYESDVTIHFQSIGDDCRFESSFEIAAFRLVQESVTNAIKHGKSRDIWVKVEWLPEAMNAIVRDNGIGFNQKEVKEKSFGLLGMKERIDLLKGELKISSEVGKGTSVFFRIPFNSTTN